MTATDWKNQLYFGDNLDILRNHVPDASVDLIYLDPPFNSNATYNVLFHEETGQQSAAQITAFEDTWHWSLESESAYQDVVTNAPGKLSDLLQAMRSFLGENDMMAYLTMMAQRMVELHRVLKDTGSIYLHCDPTASHYLKLLMDCGFGAGELTETKSSGNDIRPQQMHQVRPSSRHHSLLHQVPRYNFFGTSHFRVMTSPNTSRGSTAMRTRRAFYAIRFDWCRAIWRRLASLQGGAKSN